MGSASRPASDPLPDVPSASSCPSSDPSSSLMVLSTQAARSEALRVRRW